MCYELFCEVQIGMHYIEYLVIHGQNCLTSAEVTLLLIMVAATQSIYKLV